ncbi:hypothetical protein ACNOYE_37780 [Nannocystaceae bacterium ST9]
MTTKSPTKSPTNMTTNPRSPGIRWITLAVVAICIAYSNLTQFFDVGGLDVADISDRHHSPFTPAPFAFAIWAIIYASFLWFCVVALLPSRRGVAIYDRLGPSLMLANVLGAAWITVFRLDWIAASVVIILAMLALATVMFLRVSRAIETGRARFSFAVPFALFFAWMCVATLANLAALAIAMDWTEGAREPRIWSVAALALATSIGLAAGIRHRQFLVPAVITWSPIAIAVADRYTDPPVSAAAIVGAVVCGIAALVIGLRRALTGPRVAIHDVWPAQPSAS